MRKRPLMLAACVFLTGLAYQRYDLPILAVAGVLPAVGEWWYGRHCRTRIRTAARSFLLLAVFLLGIFHMQSEIEFRQAYMSKLTDGSRITVWGELLKMESTDYGIRGTLSDCYIWLEGQLLPCNDVQVYLPSDQYQVGQIHKITGKLNLYKKARNEGNFDALVYYQSLKIDFALEAESCEVPEQAPDQWKQRLLLVRQKLGEVYDLLLEERPAGFYRAMVLGDKTKLDEVIKELFTVGGISHILAISGLHVSILGRGFYQGLRKRGVGFAVAGLSGGVLLVLYCLMVGSSTSTVRAVGMMLLFFLAQWIGRSYDMLNSLGAMVLFLLWENPFLLENTGFWFSVTALLGVGVLGKEFGVWGMSLGITLMTLPVTALSYYEVPLYSPLVNLVVLPLLSPIFVLAVAGGVLGVWIPGLAGVLLQPCQWMFYGCEWLCQLVQRLPGASIVCGKPGGVQVVVYYGLLLAGVYFLRRERKRQEEKQLMVYIGKRAALTLVCLACICFPKDRPAEITFLDVGQGDGIYISAGDGCACFVDGGASFLSGVGENRILPFLKSKGIGRIDYWFVSHADSDHVSGIFEVLESGYPVGCLVLSEHCSNDESYDNLRLAAQWAGTEVCYMDVGDSLKGVDFEVTCLGPLLKNGQPIGEDRNENSLVLEIAWKQEGNATTFTALLAGDISTEIEEAMCQRGVLSDVDLVKANHHGSNYSNGEQWFACTRPEYIVVSCSATNTYGHPGKLAVQRMEASGGQIFYTMEMGQVTFRMTDGEMKLEKFH